MTVIQILLGFYYEKTHYYINPDIMCYIIQSCHLAEVKAL